MKYFFGFLLLLSFTACQQDSTASNANDIKLFANYYVRYLQNEQQLKADASFRKGLEKEKATKIDLAGEVRLANKPLVPVRLNNTIFRYQLEETMDFRSSYDFVLEHDSGEATKHTIALSPIGKFSLENGLASKTDGFQLNWDGAKLEKNERILLMITDKNSKAHSVTINGPSANQMSKIKGADLTGLAAGNGYIYLVKKRMQEEIQGTTVINSLAEYYTDRILVEIVE